jgi:hypothetical protein
MNVHNVMEEQVFARINALYDQVKKINPPWMTAYHPNILFLAAEQHIICHSMTVSFVQISILSV